MNYLEVGKFMFKILCFVTVLCIIIVWFNKFMQDEDLCLVEYNSFRAADDIDLPDVSLCIENPFDEQKLNGIGTTTKAYSEHLAGNGFNDSLASVNYVDVIFKFGDY